MIYVMGEGLVIEKGTHDELLSNPEGPYAKLVQAQKLRETKEKKEQGDITLDGLDDSENAHDDEKAIQLQAEDEIPLGRKETGSRSLASEILEQKKQHDDGMERQLSLPSLFVRMARINRETWWRYGLGACFAVMAGMVYPSFAIVYGALCLLFCIPTAY